MKWLRIAAEKGNLQAAMELERREKLTSDEIMLESFKAVISSGVVLKANPLDQEQYGMYIRVSIFAFNIFLNICLRTPRKKDR